MFSRLKYALLVLFLFSCKKHLGPADYVEWVNNEKNGLIVQEEAGQYLLRLKYVPAEYNALLEHSGDPYNPQVIKDDISNRSDLEYFLLEIASQDKHTDVLKNGIETKNDYYSRVEYFSSWMQKDLVLFDGEKSIPCTLFHYERDYGISPFQRFVIAFPKNEMTSSGPLTVQYNDKVLGIGTVTFKFPKNLKKDIPTLDI